MLICDLFAQHLHRLSVIVLLKLPIGPLAGSIYDRTVNVLQGCADHHIPQHKKGYGIKSSIYWRRKKLARIKYGRPQESLIRGPIFQQRKSDKLAYKIKIREGKANEQFSYSNCLHDALSVKRILQYLIVERPYV